MKVVKSWVVSCLITILWVIPGLSDSRIVLYSTHGTWYDNGELVVNRNCPIKFTFRLVNTDGQNINGLSNGFEVWTQKNGVLTNNYLPIEYDTARIGWDNYLDGGMFMNEFSTNGSGKDTVGFSGFKLFGSGIPDGFDGPVWWIVATPTVDGDSLCIDSAFFPPGGAWLWSTSSGTFAPDWGGPYCYRVYLCPCGWTTFDNCPSQVTVYANQQNEYTLYAHQSLFPSSPVDFEMLSGPGIVMETSDTSASWIYKPTSADIGTVKTVHIAAYSNSSCGTCQFTVHVDEYAPPEFTGGCNDTIPAEVGDTATHTITCTTGPESMYINTVDRTPSGTYNLNDASEILFVPASGDRGHYTFEICAATTQDTICCPVTFFVTDTVCLNRGNVDGVVAVSGPIDVSDLSYLVAYLFQEGPVPPCMEEGNVDGIVGTGGVIDVADLTYLVAYLFQGGDAPPPCL